MIPLAPTDPSRIGPYTLVERLGAGGMGAVYLGRSSGGRRVAIKVIHEHLATDPEFRRRFAREVTAARKVGGLYTAQVVDADTEAEQPWMATRFVDGQSLGRYVLANGPLAPDEVKVLAAGIAEALASIHAQGLVHRDLKPGNVMLSPDGPQVIDFGIAVDRAATSFTSTGVVLGTFEFISPEQVENRNVTAAADIFALGGLLCYAATGAPPFGRAQPAVLIARVAGAEPDLSRVTDPELASLIAACLAKRPERRPTPAQILERTAAARASTRLPFEAPPVVPAFPGSDPDSPTIPGVRGPLGLIAGTSTDGSAGGRSVRRRAVLGGAAVAVTGALGAGAWLVLRQRGGGGAPVSSDFPGHPAALYSVALSPDGTLAATVGGYGAAALYDLATGRRRRLLTGSSHSVYAIAFHPDGRRVAAATGDSTIIIWDVATGTAIRTLPYLSTSSWLWALSFSPDGQRVLAGSGDGQGALWEVGTGAFLGPLAPKAAGDAIDVDWSRDGRTLATANYEGPVRLWDASSRRLLRTVPVPGGTRSLAVSPDSTLVAAGGRDYTVHVFRIADGSEVTRFTGHTKSPLSLVWSPDGKTLVSAGADATIRFWDLASGKPSGSPITLKDSVSSVAVSADGRLLLAGTVDGRLARWDLPSLERAPDLAAPLTAVVSVAVSTDGRTVVTGARDGTIRTWTPEGRLVRAFTVPDAPRGVTGPIRVQSLAMSRDGAVIASGIGDGRIVFWDAATGTVLRSVISAPDPVTGLRYLDDGTLLSADVGGSLRRWGADGGALMTGSPTKLVLTGMASTGDGTVVVGGDDLGRGVVLDVRNGSVPRTRQWHPSRINAVDLTPDGKVGASASDDATVKLWDPASGAVLRALSGHSGKVSAVRFSPDGTQAASGGADRQVRIWDVRTGAALRTLDHPSAVQTVAYTPGGTALMACCDDGTVRRWTLG